MKTVSSQITLIYLLNSAPRTKEPKLIYNQLFIVENSIDFLSLFYSLLNFLSNPNENENRKLESKMGKKGGFVME